MFSNRTLTLFVEQSNMIEGIVRKPTAAEIDAHRRFLDAPDVSVSLLEDFVKVIQPDARLRIQVGLNVRVGNHIAPPGGPDIPVQLKKLLDQVNAGAADPWEAHCQYETQHPFSDGNGRSGRVLWLWQMKGRQLPPGLFLHQWYYQTLSNFRT